MQIREVKELDGKKILFFAPAFFGYEFKIKGKMEELGAEVDFFDERSVVSAYERAFLKVCPSIFEFKSRKYYSDILAKHQKEYDYIFIIKGDMVPVKILQEMRARYKKAKLCLYLYDSVKNIPGILKKLKYFDVKYSFDKKDCSVYPDLKLRPLFFADEFRKENRKENQYKYDISFCGTIHSDRYKIIKEIEEICNKKKYKFYWFGYLQSKFVYYYYKITKSEFRNCDITIFKFDKLNSKDIADIVENSRIVLDMQHPKQTGLTMRTIEMIGMKKKVVTTNKEIEQYDFYRPENICIIDRNNIQINDEFLKLPYQELDKKTYEEYSLDSWVLEVLEANR